MWVINPTPPYFAKDSVTQYTLRKKIHISKQVSCYLSQVAAYVIFL